MQGIPESIPTNFMVVAFFIVGTIVLTFLGWRFASDPNPVFRQFGIGLGFVALASAIWSVIVWVHPDELEFWNSIGVSVFVPSYFFFLNAATENWLPRSRKLVLVGAAAYLIALFALRTFVLPSEPSFSERGLFYFNAQPLVLLLYIVSFAGSASSAVYAVVRAITLRWLATTTLVSFNLVIMCSVILLASYDDDLQIYNGLLMGIGFLALFAVYLRYKPA